MRALYAERQAVLVEATASELGDLLEVRPADAGMNLMGWLPTGVDDRVISEQAAAHDVEALPLSAFCIERTLRPGLSLGYTGISAEEIRAGVRRLAVALTCVQNNHTPA
jgi:GntR family transcriptional regulator/MocR family aminotransferase